MFPVYLKKKKLNEPKTNAGLFEVLTCDQHVISLT